MRKFFRTTYHFGVIALFLAVAAIGFTQTGVFRSYLRGLIVDAAAQGLEGTFSLSQVKGNLFTGFRVDSVEVKAKNQQVLFIERLEARYDPLSLLAKRLSFSRITLTKPIVLITRSTAGIWNTSELLKPTPPDTTPSSWVIDITQLQVIEGRFSLIDSLVLARRASDSSFSLPTGQIDYANVQIDSLDLDAGATIRSGSSVARVRSLAFQSASPAFLLRRLRGECAVSKDGASVRNLLVETRSSQFQLDAAMRNVDITRIDSVAQLRSAPLSLRVRAERIDFTELKQFIGSAVDFLDRDVACEIDAEGTLAKLEVKNATVRTASSLLSVSGTILHLDHPRDLSLDLACVKNRIDPVDIAEHLPGLRLPQLAGSGIIEYNLLFKGTPLSFKAEVMATSRAGTVSAEGNLDIRESDLVYEGTIQAANLDLASLTEDSLLTSRLNASISVKGSGLTLDNTVTLVRAEVDSSEFYGLPVGHSVLVMDLADRTLRSRLAARLGATRLDFSGTMRFQPRDLVSYEFGGRVNSLNLADLTKRSAQSSDLSFDLKVTGTGLALPAMRGNVAVRFYRSSFDTVRFEGGGLEISLNTLDREKQSFRFASEAADLSVEGQFTPSSLITTLAQGATLLGEAIQHRIESLDSLRAFSSGRGAVSEFSSKSGDPPVGVRARFAVRINDAAPIGVLLRRRLEGRLTIDGEISTAQSGTSVGGKVNVAQLYFADGSTNLGLRDATASYRIDGLARATVMQSMTAALECRVGEFQAQSLQTSNVRADVSIRGDSSRFHLSGLLDSLVTVEARGMSGHDSGLVVVNCERLVADFGSYAFENIDPVRALVGRDGLHIANLWMRHEVEEISAAGYFNPAGISDISVGVRNFLLNNLPKVYPAVAPEGGRGSFGGILNAAGTFKGSFDHPNFSLELNATGVRYQETVFGQILVRASYFEQMLNLFTQFRSRPDDLSVKPDLLITGTVPYNLSFKGSSEKKLEGEMNLDVRANNFRLEFLDPFISPFSNMSGLLICDMKLRGTVESPSYGGSMTLQNAQFLFNPVGIQYIVDGRLVPNGRQIGLDGLIIRNVPQDRPDGKMVLSGRFTLEGVEIKDFNLAADGQLLVMKEFARRTGQIIYGDLVAASGAGGIQWRGSPSRSLVSGNLMVKYANLTLPPTRAAQELPSSRIAVTLINDVDEPNRARGNIPSTPTASLSGGPRSPEGSPVPRSQADSRSFLDNIDYDLLIQTLGVTQLRFVFTNLTNEELFATLQGRTTFTKSGDQVRLTGEVELGSGSYYNNIKKLDASGKLRFTGAPFNPELDVLARYEGIYRGRRDTASTVGGSSAGSTSSTDERGLEQKVVVKLHITGTREQPKVKTELERYDQFGNIIQESRGDVEADAIAFLITGSFRDELTQQDRISLASTSVLGGLTSSVLSGPLTDLLRKEFGIIRSVDVLYYGGSFQESADLRVTGELGDAVFRLGGRVLNDINNTNVSIQLPMSAILGSEKWRNLVLEAERRVEGVETIDQRRESKGLRLLYRITF